MIVCHFMSFFVPARYSNSLPGSISQPLKVGGSLAALGTALSRHIKRKGMPSFRAFGRGRSVKRRRFNRAASRMRGGIKRRNAPSGRGVTFEHDRQFIYRKKRMPRRRKRRWLTFTRKVKAASEGSLGSRTVLFNVSKVFSNSTSQVQGRVNVCLYGWDSTNTGSPWHNDLRYISKLENTNVTNDQSMSDDASFLFQSGVLDITLRNTSTIHLDGPPRS